MNTSTIRCTTDLWLCPGVPVHRENNHCTPLFMNLCLAVEHCWVFCIGSCEPVHEDRTPFAFVFLIYNIYASCCFQLQR